MGQTLCLAFLFSNFVEKELEWSCIIGNVWFRI